MTFWIVGLFEEVDNAEEEVSVEDVTLLDSAIEVDESKVWLVFEVPFSHAARIAIEMRKNGRGRLFIIEPPVPHHTHIDGLCRGESSISPILKGFKDNLCPPGLY